MIPGKIIRFLDTAGAAAAGTRNASLVPRIHKVSGWIVEPDGETMVCLIANTYTGQLTDNLDDNGRFTVTVVHIVSHETYQFKGEYIDQRPVTPEDLSVFESVRRRCVEQVQSFDPSAGEDIVAAHVVKPDTAVRFKVREIFLQTPGPGAGKRLYPPEGS